MVDVPFRPMNDHFVTILVFFAVFVGRRVPFFGHSLLSYSKRRHLSTSRVIPLIDCHQSLYFQHRLLSTFLPDLCFIWQSHRFQFLVFALPIGIWHLLMDHIKIIKWSPLKLFYKSTIHEKCAHCPYKTLKFGERSDSLKSFSGDHIKTANKIDAPIYESIRVCLLIIDF